MISAEFSELRRHGDFLIPLITATMCSMILSACIPMNTIIQETPDWTGIIIDAKDLEPAEGIVIKHVKFQDETSFQFPLIYWDNPIAKSDIFGAFSLPGIVTEKVEMHLPVSGMVYENAFISLEATRFHETLILGQNMRRNDININDVGYIALDSNPEIIAPLPFYDISPDLTKAKALFQSCNKTRLQITLEKMNTARKVLQMAGWQKFDEGEFLNPKEREILLSLYSGIPKYWNWLQQSCTYDAPGSYTKTKLITDNIQLEVESIIEVVSPLDGTQ